MGCVYRQSQRDRKTGQILYDKDGNKKRRPTWWIKYRSLDGRLRHESSKSTKKTVADALLRAREHATDQGLLVTPEIGKLKFADAVAMLVNYHKARRRNTKKLEGRIRKHLTSFFGPNRLMTTITGALVAEYVVKRQAEALIIPAKTKRTRKGLVHVPERRKPTADATINRELAMLKQMFTVAIKLDKLVKRPTIELLKERNVRQGFFEPDQIASVINHLPRQLRPVVRFAYLTGWRLKSEVLSRQWRHVDLKEGTISLFEGEAKNREPRTIYLTTELRQLLEEQRAEHDRMKKNGKVVPWVFHRRGQPIKSLGKAFRTACVRAGCPGRLPHDLRRTAVRRFVRSGISETVAMKMTGHKTRAVFDRYNITSADDLRDAAARLDARPDVATDVG